MFLPSCVLLKDPIWGGLKGNKMIGIGLFYLKQKKGPACRGRPINFPMWGAGLDIGRDPSSFLSLPLVHQERCNEVNLFAVWKES